MSSHGDTRAPRVGVIDYGMGNRRSVEKALEHAGASASITARHEELLACDGLVLPGVGAFPLAMRNLERLGLAELIRARVSQGVPLLGICLGMQLLFDRSEEIRPTPGLGLIAGSVSQLQTSGLSPKSSPTSPTRKSSAVSACASFSVRPELRSSPSTRIPG